MASRPTHVVRANTGRKDQKGNDVFMTVGAVWPFERGDGFNIRINALPVPFDGHLMVVPSKDEE
jgi:hypothetical protein